MIYTHTITRHGLIHFSDGSVLQAVFQIPIGDRFIRHEQLERQLAEEWRRQNPRAKNKVTRIKLFRRAETTESPSKAPASIIDSPVRAAYTKSIYKNI